jgi:hypothetical protein
MILTTPFRATVSTWKIDLAFVLTNTIHMFRRLYIDGLLNYTLFVRCPTLFVWCGFDASQRTCVVNAAECVVGTVIQVCEVIALMP